MYVTPATVIFETTFIFCFIYPYVTCKPRFIIKQILYYYSTGNCHEVRIISGAGMFFVQEGGGRVKYKIYVCFAPKLPSICINQKF